MMRIGLAQLRRIVKEESARLREGTYNQDDHRIVLDHLEKGLQEISAAYDLGREGALEPRDVESLSEVYDILTSLIDEFGG
jgi:hypothetical protein